MAAEGGSYLLSGDMVRAIRKALKKLAAYPARPPRNWRTPRYAGETIALRCRVIGIDVTTWGAGRKKLAVQRLKTHPFGYSGEFFYADGWIDSPIVCGQEVLCLRVARVEGDPDDSPAFMALPIFAVDQSNLDEPDPTVTVHVVDPARPLTPTAPCEAV